MLSGENPSARIRLFKEERRERFLSPEELRRVNQALLDEPDWRWRAFFRVALMLGTRRSELLSVRWADIDLKQRTLRLPETKAGRPHFLPLPEPACNALSIPAELRQVRMGVPIQPQERAYRRTREGLATHSRAGRR